ncbi:MAG TPA: GDP-mannose 4,6-dehydratase, partial [Chitinophagaceae bacterium]|nr:GDP-mannose 4,6-dehydratase [Chitinophagaceae bacterium]
FIGSHLGEKLLSNGHSVVGLDNFDSFYARKFKTENLKILNNSDAFTFIEADIRNISSLRNIFINNKIDIVIHLAAKAGVRPSMENVAEYYEVNMGGTVNLLECMREYGISKLIFGSSSSVYGNNAKVPFSENDAVDHPISPYAATKRSGELLCHVYTHLYKFDISCLRFFTVFGPRQRPDLAIHKFTRLIDEGKPVPFFGDGSTARDYTYIEDIVNGITCSADNLKGFNIYNLGESRIVTLKELVQVIENSLGKKAILNELPLQQGDVNITYADISKAKKEIGYDPKYNFEKGIRKFTEWYNSSRNFLYK